MDELIDAVTKLLDRRPVPVTMHLDDWGALADGLKKARTERTERTEHGDSLTALYVIVHGEPGMYRTEETAIHAARELIKSNDDRIAHVARVTHRVNLKRTAEVEMVL